MDNKPFFLILSVFVSDFQFKERVCLSNICNVTHAKATKNNNFLLKITIFRGHMILIPNSKTSLGCTFESLEIVVAYQ